jgi:hypothetical protein
MIVLGVILSCVALYPISLLKYNLKNLENLGNIFAKKLHDKWAIDKKINYLVVQSVSLLILQLLNMVFLREYIVTLFLAVGLLIVIHDLIVYLREYYLVDLQKLLEQLQNDKK